MNEDYKNLYEQFKEPLSVNCPHENIKTKLECFKAIFRDKILPIGCSIKWLKTNVLLAYFIKKLFHSENHFNVWVKSEKIFGIKNLRQSENNPYPKGYEKIDEILKNLYTHLQ